MELPRHFGWWVVALAVLSLPLLLVSALTAAIQLPQLDGTTMRMPGGVRQTVAGAAMDRAGFGKDSRVAVDRVLRLDPENAAAWARRCVSRANEKEMPADARPTCERAVALGRTIWTLNNLGRTQERTGDTCAAEDSYTSANTLANAQNGLVLRNLGRAALGCGHAGASAASLELAERDDVRDAADPDDDGDAADDLLQDRNWLVVAYTANRQPREAAAACANGHPGWKSCSCHADGSEMKCVEAR